MFAYIKGSLEEKSNNYVVIETGGIGYKIFMSEPAINQLGDIGDLVKVYTHYHVREDEISLYGFLSNEELKTFELLISVSGVGTKLALVILANIEPSSFALAVISNDTSKLVKIPGIGAKTAARMILELKDKLKNNEIISRTAKEEKIQIYDEEKVNEAIAALQVLGYNRREIEKVMQKLEKEDLSVEELIKECLKNLSKR